MGEIYVAIEPIKYEDLDQKLRIEQQTFNIFSAEDLQVNDKLDGFRIRRVLNLMGITIAESQ
jgi:hypothetical protein